jgi:hypothetical protein
VGGEPPGCRGGGHGRHGCRHRTELLSSAAVTHNQS